MPASPRASIRITAFALLAGGVLAVAQGPPPPPPPGGAPVRPPMEAPAPPPGGAQAPLPPEVLEAMKLRQQPPTTAPGQPPGMAPGRAPGMPPGMTPGMMPGPPAPPLAAPNVIAPSFSRDVGAKLPPPAPGSSTSIRLNGIVEPVQSQLVTAPRITGGGPGGGAGPQLQLVIVKLARAGTMVRKGDLLVEFDRTSQLKNARDREAEYRDNLAQIDKKNAEQITARAARQTGLRLAENAVRRAELDLVGVEMLPKITAEKNQQVLEEARAKLAQVKKNNDLQERAAAADLRILEIQRDRSKNAWDHATRNATKMRILSPIEGMVVLRSVFKSGSMAEMQEGEEVRPGIPILDVVDPSAMRVRAAVNQADVASLVPGMPVRITLDSFPSRTFDGRLETLSPVATASMMSARVRTFVAVFSIDGGDPHLLPDLAAAVEVEPAPLEGSRR